MESDPLDLKIILTNFAKEFPSKVAIKWTFYICVN